MDDISKSVKDVVDILEQFYVLKFTEVSKKIDNIKRINIDSLADRIQEEVEKGNIKTKSDIVKYVESIIPD